MELTEAVRTTRDRKRWRGGGGELVALVSMADMMMIIIVTLFRLAFRPAN